MATKKPEKKVNTKASPGAKKTPTKATSKKIEKKVQKKPEVKKKTTEKVQNEKPDLHTHSGHKLTLKEAKFISAYVEHGNGTQAIRDAGYQTVAPGQYATDLLKKPYIKEEIEFRLEESKKKSIADRDEIMSFFTRMMRGEILDQFDMPTTNGDKIKAGIELAKRSIDIEDRLKERQAQATSVPEIKISLDWGGNNGQEE